MVNQLQNKNPLMNVSQESSLTAHEYGLVAGKVLDRYHPETVRIIIHKDGIRIGCGKISIDAAKYLVSKWEEKFGNTSQDSYELQ